MQHIKVLQAMDGLQKLQDGRDILMHQEVEGESNLGICYDLMNLTMT